MKNQYYLRILLITLISVLLFSGCEKKTSTADEDVITDVLKIYCYDSFATWGLGPKIVEEFEKKYDCKVILQSVGGGSTLVNHIIFEKNDPQADIAIGILNTQMNKVLDADVFYSFEPKTINNIKNKNLIVDKQHRLIPFDYSYYAFVYNSEILNTPPKTFGEMQSSVWKDKIILIDPRTSATGYGLLVWTLSVFGERGFVPYWRSLKDNVLTIPASWSEAYTAFLTDEAPIVLSYATSPAYHIEVDNSYKYKAFIPQEGALKEIELAGILKGAKNMYLAKRFIEFMLTHDFQKHIPTTQWMFPVIDGVELPKGFAACPIPESDLSDKAFENSDFFSDKWIDVWINTVSKK